MLKNELQRESSELRQITDDIRAAKREARTDWQLDQVRSAKRKRQEIFQIQIELRAVQEGAEGALPDFAVIEAAKCGKTFFYHLLTKRPRETLKVDLDFLDLPDWDPGASDLSPGYQAAREYFGPHNQRLYEYLGGTRVGRSPERLDNPYVWTAYVKALAPGVRQRVYISTKLLVLWY